MNMSGQGKEKDSEITLYVGGTRWGVSAGTPCMDMCEREQTQFQKPRHIWTYMGGGTWSWRCYYNMHIICAKITWGGPPHRPSAYIRISSRYLFPLSVNITDVSLTHSSPIFAIFHVSLTPLARRSRYQPRIPVLLKCGTHQQLCTWTASMECFCGNRRSRNPLVGASTTMADV